MPASARVEGRAVRVADPSWGLQKLVQPAPDLRLPIRHLACSFEEAMHSQRELRWQLRAVGAHQRDEQAVFTTLVADVRQRSNRQVPDLP